MTAVLAMSYRGAPCLLGDTMIISGRRPEHPVILPVSGKSSLDSPIRWGTHYVTEFRQKLNLIGPELIVAWAGSRIEASAAVGHLRCGYKNIDPSNLHELRVLVDSLRELGIQETTLICLLATEECWSISISGSVQLVTTPWGENGYAAGVGGDDLFDSLAATTQTLEQSNADQAIAAALNSASQMWFRDLFGVSTELGFGGAYEVAGIENNRFTKVDNILYSSFAYDRNQGLSFTPLFKKVDYYNDYMIVRILDFPDAVEKGSMSLARPNLKVYSIAPVDAPNSAPSPSLEEIIEAVPDFNAVHVVTHVYVQPAQRHDFVPAFSVYDKWPIGDGPIQFISDDKWSYPREFSVVRWYLKKIEDRVFEYFDETGESVESLPRHW